MPRRLRPLGGTPTTRAARTPAKGALSSQELLENLAGGPGHSENILGAFDYGDLRSTLRHVDAIQSRDSLMFLDTAKVRKANEGMFDDTARESWRTRGHGIVDGNEAPLRVPRAKLDHDPDTGDLVVTLPDGDETAHVYANYLLGAGVVERQRLPIRVTAGNFPNMDLVPGNLSGMVRIGNERVTFKESGLPERALRSVESRINADAYGTSLANRSLQQVRNIGWAGSQLGDELTFANQAALIINRNKSDPLNALREVARLQGMDPELKPLASKVANTMERIQDQGFGFSASAVTEYHRGAMLNRSRYQNSAGLMAFNNMDLKANMEFRFPFGFEYQGTSPEVILHEYVHATTSAAVYFSRSKRAPDHIKEGVAELDTILRRVRGELEEARIAGGNQVADEDMVNYLLQTNVVDDVDELLAWGLTNRDFQSVLRNIAVDEAGQTLWQSLVKAISRILGIDAPVGSALERVLVRGNELLDYTAQDGRGGLMRGLEDDLADAFSGF